MVQLNTTTAQFSFAHLQRVRVHPGHLFYQNFHPPCQLNCPSRQQLRLGQRQLSLQIRHLCSRTLEVLLESRYPSGDLLAFDLDQGSEPGFSDSALTQGLVML
jgi:hypothetical protein